MCLVKKTIRRNIFIKKVLHIISLLFFSIVIFTTCGSKEQKLEQTLTKGSGTWTFITKAGEGKFLFFEDGSVRVDDDGEVDATYKISADGSVMKIQIVDSEVYTTMKNIKIESDKEIKADISKNGKAKTEPCKLVR